MTATGDAGPVGGVIPAGAGDRVTGSGLAAATGVILPISICVGWGVGSVVPIALMAVLSNLFLLYVVNTVGLSAALAATILGTTRIFDALIDTVMGGISDRTHSRWGRRRPYLLVGGVLCAISSVALFSVPQGLSHVQTVSFVTAALVFYALAATTFNVPYMAMPVEITPDQDQRTRLISYRIYGFSIGSLLGGAAAPWLVTQFGGGQVGFTATAMILGLIILAASLFSFFMTANAPFARVEMAPGRLPQIRQIRQALGSKPLRQLFVVTMLININASVSATGLAFFITVVLGESLSILGLYVGIVSLAVVVSQKVWLQVTKAYGKKRTCILTILCYALAQLSWLLATASEPVWVACVRSFLIGLSAGGTLLCSQALLPEVLQYEVDRTGERYEGIITGIFSALERASGALGIIAGGAMLSFWGYVSGGDIAQQPNSAVTAIYVIVGIVPVVCLFLSAAVLTRYQLSR
jgi:GPH family glycoside/pentoside/hexuronide:cation symporter